MSIYPRLLLLFATLVASVAGNSAGAAKPQKEPPVAVAVRTNALAIPLLNLGVEAVVAPHWTVGADAYYPWIPRPRQSEGVDYTGRCLQALAGNLEGRYWFDKALRGHSIGAFTMAGWYDVEYNFHGYQGGFGSVGIDYLYAIPVFQNKLRLEFSLGLGFFLSRAREYQVYESGGRAYTEKDMAKDITYFGPVKAGVSVVVPIVFSSKRGGGL